MTEVNVPRRMACLVMIPNQVSIWLIGARDPDGQPLRGQYFLHAQRVPLDQVVLRPRRRTTAAARQTGQEP